MRRMVALSHPDVLEPEAVLASISPDEAMFAAQTVAYYVKYQNAHVRFASGWPDPTRLHLAPLPANGGAGGTIFWSTGATLLRYGRNKRDAAAYAIALTHDERIWRRSMGTGRDAAGQLPAFSTLPGWSSETPTWMAEGVPAAPAAMSEAKPYSTPRARGRAVQGLPAVLGGVSPRFRAECAPGAQPGDGESSRGRRARQRIGIVNDLYATTRSPTWNVAM